VSRPVERQRSQSVEVRKALTAAPALLALYPPSFRFVIFMNSTLLLFSPHSNTVAVAVLRNSIRTANLTPASSRHLVVEETADRSNSLRTLSNSSDTEEDGFAEMIHSNSGRLLAQERRFRSDLSRSTDIIDNQATTQRPRFSSHDGLHADGDELLSDQNAMVNTGGVTSPTVRSISQ
jgi:hypothetical protein